MKSCDAYFFTNNPNIKSTIKANGWNYIFIDFPLSKDEAVSSFQSKYIKFLQFLEHEEYAFFKNYDVIVYVDHKLKLTDFHIKYALSKLGRYKILVRDHPENRQNIWEEVGTAMFQERYLRYMPETIDWIREKIKEGYSDKSTVATTGLIFYKHLNNDAINFVNNVYNDLKKIGTSECQIVWSMLAQKHSNIIKIISWNELDIKWEDPKKEDRYFTPKAVLKLFIPFGLLELWKIIKR
ncbi:MAG: hypothetical protein FWD02_03405 [Bacteroidales bacterium]|nr:hypothetical protein [Bacteroidales bacterium]